MRKCGLRFVSGRSSMALKAEVQYFDISGGAGYANHGRREEHTLPPDDPWHAWFCDGWGPATGS